MIVGRDHSLIARACTLALRGMSKDAWHRFGDSGYKHYQVMECGFKYSMMDLQAAIGIHRLARIETNWVRRQAIWGQYQLAFADLPVSRPSDPEPGTRHAYHLYTLHLDTATCNISRDTFLDAMTKAGIGVGVHYLSIPEHSYYQNFLGWRAERWPEARKIGRQTVSLPLSPSLDDGDVLTVIHAVQDVLKRAT